MSKVLITPIKSEYCNVKPYELIGELKIKIINGEKYYYIKNESFPERIVTVLEGDV